MIPHIAVISSGRPGRVADMKGHLGRLAGLETWYVGAGEGPDYEYAGAENVIESGGLVQSRNLALDNAFAKDTVAVELSDDLTAVDWCFDHKTKHRITLERAIGMMVSTLTSYATSRRFGNESKTIPHLAGAAATDNAMFMPKDDISEHAFVIGDFIAVLPTPLRFDEGLHLKEDLDYSIQHIQRYGGVLRMNTILANWQHRTNHGGAVQFRTEAGEEEACRYIEQKHPGWTRRNAKRDLPELLLVYPPIEPPAFVSPLRQEA